jgi:hypothetical protein
MFLKTVNGENLGALKCLISILLKLPATTILFQKTVDFHTWLLGIVAAGWREGWGHENDSKKSGSCCSMFPIDCSLMLYRRRSK